MTYASVEDFRAEGVDVAVASDARLRALEEEARATIDGVTGWWFEPRPATFFLDGRGSEELELPVPALTLDRVRVAGEDLPLDRILRVSERGAGMAPSLVRIGGVFPRGRYNVEVRGTFGVVDKDGRTPLLIRLATILLVLRRLTPLAAAGSIGEREREARIIEEKTRDQSVKYAPPSEATTKATARDDVEAILLRFRRPGGLGAV